MIPGNNVTVREHFQNPMQDIARATFVQDNVILLWRPFNRANLNYILFLPEQGHHAKADIGVDKIALFIEDFFKT